MSLEHEEIEDLLGAYALDAVEDSDRLEIERHLESCPVCRAEVSRHREVAALVSGPEQPPPDQVWERIRARLKGSREGPESPPEARRPRPGTQRLVAALAAAALVAVGFLGWRVVELEGRIDRGGSVVAAAEAALADPDARRLVLRSEDAALAADVVVLPDGTAYLFQDNLEPLPGDRTYQLWAMVGERPISAAVLGPDPGVTPFRVGEGTGALAITEEGAGGAQAPTSDPIATASLS
jgi:anti-sigma-K factor RskA